MSRRRSAQVDAAVAALKDADTQLTVVIWLIRDRTTNENAQKLIERLDDVKAKALKLQRAIRSRDGGAQ